MIIQLENSNLQFKNTSFRKFDLKNLTAQNATITLDAPLTSGVAYTFTIYLDITDPSLFSNQYTDVNIFKGTNEKNFLFGIRFLDATLYKNSYIYTPSEDITQITIRNWLKYATLKTLTIKP